MQLTKKKLSVNMIYFELISVVGIFIRFLGVGFESSDYSNCIYQWYLQLIENGPGIDALRYYRGDYTLPYVFLLWILTKIPIPFAWSVRMLHLPFDLAAAFFAGKIAEHMKPADGKNLLLGYAAVLLWPTVFLNSSYWAQCDMVYLVFVLAALYCMLKEKHILMMFLVGVAFAIKLQTVFFLPFLVLYYWIEKKMSILHFLVIPVAALLTNIPTFCAGIPLSDMFAAYFVQGGAYPWLYYFYPNLWFFFQAAPYYMFSGSAVLLALTVLLSFAILLIVKKVRMSQENLLPVLLWTAYSAAFFMPHMHERYGFLAEVTAVILAVTQKQKRWIPLAMLLCILPKYLDAIYVIQLNRTHQGMMAVANTIVYLAVTCTLWKALFVNRRKERYVEDRT